MLRAERPSPGRFHVLLVVTDEETKRRIWSQLSHSYYRITTCASFNEAVGFFETENFDVDLVLSDIPLEVEDGYDFISKIQLLRKNAPHVVIFVAESLVDPEVMKAYQFGACYVLRKPVGEKSDEIENLWKHALRWRAQNEDLWQQVLWRRVQNVRSSSVVASQQESLKRGYEFVNHGEEPSLRKQRMVWDEFLDALFVKVVNELGKKNAGPKRILEVMNERQPGLDFFLTKEQVGSHLQKHREKEKKKQLPQRRMNNVNGRNVMTVNQILPKLVSSSHSDMSHLHLPEASTSNSSVPQMQPHHYNPQLSVCPPMLLKNSSEVTSLIGNRSCNLISECQPDSHVNTTRPAMHQPERITCSNSNMPQQRQPEGPSFEGMESNMQQQEHLAMCTSFRRSNMQQIPKTQNLTSSNIEEQPITDLTSGRQQLDQNPSMQQVDQYPSSVSENINQDKAPGTPFGRSNMEELAQNHYLGSSFENSNMEQQLITQNLTSSTQQLDETSCDLYPIRSGHDRMITLEATGVDEFPQSSVPQSSDVGDIFEFPTYGGFLDAFEGIQHPFEELNNTGPSQLPNQ